MPDLQGRSKLAAKLAHEIGVRVSKSSDAHGLLATGMAREGIELNGDGHSADGAGGIVRYAYGNTFRAVTSHANPSEPKETALSDEPGAGDLLPGVVGQGTVQPAQGASSKKGRGARKVETREELLARLLDPTLTLEETARMLEVCPATVRRYTNRGILPHERSKGNQRRFKLSTVLAFMESQSRVEPHDETR